MRRAGLACALALIGAFASAGPTAAVPPGPPPTGLVDETIFLDTREVLPDSTPNHAGPISTTQPLTPNATYVAEVTGTYSVWAPSLWTAPPCGTPRPLPMFPSPGTTNKKVGLDAETVFATVRSRCVSPLPQHRNHFEINQGAGFAHVEPFGGPFSAPRPGHSYRYELTGQGLTAAFSFQLRDDPLSDNYGRLRVRITRVTPDGQCKKNGWRAFLVFKNQGDCVSYFATKTKNQPALGPFPTP